jgi:deazaflavin-dependent oxidoreductase (nitroreductase family)
MSSEKNRRYVRPNRFTRHVFNPVVAGLTRLGLSVWGSRVLEVQGRSSGLPRTTPVNVLTVDGERYIVAPRGTTEWVRNARVAGTVRLHLGRATETVTLAELPDQAKPALLREYLRRWKWEVGQFFDGVGPDATDERLSAIAPGYPVFHISPVA